MVRNSLKKQQWVTIILISLFVGIVGVALLNVYAHITKETEYSSATMIVNKDGGLNDTQVGDEIINSGEVVGTIDRVEVSCTGNGLIHATLKTRKQDGVYLFEGYDVYPDNPRFSFMLRNRIVKGELIAFNQKIEERREELWVNATNKTLMRKLNCDGNIFSELKDNITMNGEEYIKVELNTTFVNNQSFVLSTERIESFILLNLPTEEMSKNIHNS